jgi:uncharacterized membrane protein
VVIAAIAYGAGFGWLALQRHWSGGSHAEDLGFTDQVIWNFLRGQWFRMSLYQGATWNTEIDVTRLARPDSLLAFHVEPMLLAFVPLYAAAQAWSDVLARVGGQVPGEAVAVDPASPLLLVQAVGVGLGAVPAYRLGRYWSGSLGGGGAVAAAYLLSPLGQWAVLSDFHTAALAAPLLVLAVERKVLARSSGQALACAALALTAREDVGPVVALFGLVGLLTWRTQRRSATASAAVMLVLGLGWTVVGALVIAHYSGGASPFQVRYGPAFADPPVTLVQAVTRPNVLGFVAALLGSGAWLALLAPLALVPALPTLAQDVLSSSPWMASGTAHYAVLILPIIAVGAAAGLGTLRKHRSALRVASAAVVVASLSTYLNAGSGPFAANFSPATVTPHAQLAAQFAASIPPNSAVSASTALVPRVSRRARVYVFPAVEDADVVFVDVTSTPAPTSAGDVFLRVRALLTDGDWSVQRADDGLLLLARGAPGTHTLDLPPSFFTFAHPAPAVDTTTSIATFLNGDLDLVGATFITGLDSAVEPDGPRWVLQTTWRGARPLPPATHPVVVLDLADGEELRLSDVAALFWLPPPDWPPGQLVQVDVPGIPIRQLRSWRIEVAPG